MHISNLGFLCRKFSINFLIIRYVCLNKFPLLNPQTSFYLIMQQNSNTALVRLYKQRIIISAQENNPSYREKNSYWNNWNKNTYGKREISNKEVPTPRFYFIFLCKGISTKWYVFGLGLLFHLIDLFLFLVMVYLWILILPISRDFSPSILRSQYF